MTKLKDRVIPEDEIIPATFDPVFKAVLTDESCREYLADIVSYITKIPKIEIMNNLIIRNSELTNDKVKEKRKTTDLIIDVLNNRINLEMNQEYYEGIIEKNNAYHDKLLSEQYLSGDDYVDAKKVIQINFDLYNRYDDREIIKFMIMDIERGLKETENYEKYHVSLDLIREKYYNNIELSKEEKELLLLTMIKKDEIKKVAKGDKVMENVEKKLLDLSEDEELVGVYDKDIVDRKVRNSKIRYGIKKGIEEAVNQRNIEIAKKMLNNNDDINYISEITGLSIKDINNLK